MHLKKFQSLILEELYIFILYLQVYLFEIHVLCFPGMPCIMLQGRSQKKNKGVSKTHDHGVQE